MLNTTTNANILDRIVFIKRVCLFIPFRKFGPDIDKVEPTPQQPENNLILGSSTPYRIHREGDDDVKPKPVITVQQRHAALVLAQQKRVHAERERSFLLPITLACVCQSWRETMICFNGAAEIWSNVNITERLDDGKKNIDDLMSVSDNDEDSWDDNDNDDDDSALDLDDVSFDGEEEEESESDEKLNRRKKRCPSYDAFLPANILINRLIYNYTRKLNEIMGVTRMMSQGLRSGMNTVPETPQLVDLSWIAHSLLKAGAHPIGPNAQLSYVESCCYLGWLELLQVLCEDAPIIYHSASVHNNNGDDKKKKKTLLDVLLFTDEKRYGEKTHHSPSLYGSGTQQWVRRSERNPLFTAIRNRHRHIVDYLLTSLPKEIISKLINRPTSFWDDGATCLHAAIFNHDFELVQLLIEKGGADPHQMVEYAPTTRWEYDLHRKVQSRSHCPLTPTIACFKFMPNRDPFETIMVTTVLDGDSNDDLAITSQHAEVIKTPTSFIFNYLYPERVGKCCTGIDIFELLVRKYKASPNGLERMHQDRNESKMIFHASTAQYRRLAEKQRQQQQNQLTTIDNTWVYRSHTPFMMALTSLVRSQLRQGSKIVLQPLPLPDEHNSPGVTTVWTIRKLVEEYSALARDTNNCDGDGNDDDEVVDLRALILDKDGNDFKNALLLAIESENYEVVKYFLEEKKNEIESKNLIDLRFTNAQGMDPSGFSVLTQDIRIARMVSSFCRG